MGPLLSDSAREARHGRVGSFLLGSLRTAAGKYAAAIDDFNNKIVSERGCGFDLLDEEDQDFSLADRVIDLCETAMSSEGYAAGACLIAAMSKVHPRRNFRTAWKCLDTWRQRYPAAEAPAMPAFLAFAVANWLELSGRGRFGMGILLCFCGLLRASEALNLVERNLIDCGDSLVIVLNQTKRGVFQKVVITHPAVLTWFRFCRAKYPKRAGDKVVTCSYSTFNKWMRRATAKLGFDTLHWTSHSLRRGGATELLRLGVSLPDIMLHGRWLSARSAREYLRRGDVAMLRFNEMISNEAFAAAHTLAGLGAYVWSL
jgi:integrase